MQKPGSIAHHTAVVAGDKMYLFGGSGPRSSELSTPLWALDLTKLRWEPIVARSEVNPLTRDDHSAVAIGDQYMVIFGGFVDGGERTNETWKYVIATNRWERITWPASAPAPSARAAHSAIARGNEMIIFGGRDEDNEKLNDIWSFNCETSKWTKITPANPSPLPRCGHSATMYNENTMLIFGGIFEVTKELNDLQSFDFTTRKWQAIFEELSPAATANVGGGSPVRPGMITSPESTPFSKFKTGKPSMDSGPLYRP